MKTRAEFARRLRRLADKLDPLPTIGVVADSAAIQTIDDLHEVLLMRGIFAPYTIMPTPKPAPVIPLPKRKPRKPRKSA